jgi:hypothetical protein
MFSKIPLYLRSDSPLRGLTNKAFRLSVVQTRQTIPRTTDYSS